MNTQLIVLKKYIKIYINLLDSKLENCCIRLVIYLNCTMMHGLTNLKFYI